MFKVSGNDSTSLPGVATWRKVSPYTAQITAVGADLIIGNSRVRIPLAVLRNFGQLHLSFVVAVLAEETLNLIGPLYMASMTVHVNSNRYGVNVKPAVDSHCLVFREVSTHRHTQRLLRLINEDKKKTHTNSIIF